VEALATNPVASPCENQRKEIYLFIYQYKNNWFVEYIHRFYSEVK
jgi:hypothetical protein